ncbi:VanW family protein [Tomitella biformata]|uniref:VanW family protein n=1 Tax=Tomitella biformata TaxID=630403 RepID=UPI000465C9FB|nr:VanW family protein [Tomitella biformata]
MPGHPAPPAGSDAPRWGRRLVWAVAGALVLAGGAYVVDLALSSGQSPRGVRVAGIEVGGMTRGEVAQVIGAHVDQIQGKPLIVQVGDITQEVMPSRAGLTVDLDSTLDLIGTQPLNPLTRLTSLFGSRDIEIIPLVNTQALASVVGEVEAAARVEPVEGAIELADGLPVETVPTIGQALADPAAAQDALAAQWFSGEPIVLAAETLPTRSRPAQVRAMFEDVAVPATSADVVVTGHEGARAVLAPPQVAEVLRFELGEDGVLNPVFDAEAATRILAPQLEPTETKTVEATVRLAGGRPEVVPSTDGERINWEHTLAELPALLGAQAVNPARETPAVYEPAPAAFTTADAEAMGIKEVISEYTTGGFSYASGVNIRQVAKQVNGAVVRPGDTFSLNGYTGPRGTAQGYVESGIINNGRADNAVGGGISQFATTLYNAAYFAGLEDAGHTEHSYYISRYPAGREATVFEGAIDLQFRANSDTGVLIEAIGTGSDITVRVWGTKTVDVTSKNGGRWAPTQPNTVTVTEPDCSPSGGAPGFTTSDTRIIKDANSGKQLSSSTRNVRYDPSPIVVCK